ncbi:unnamed protein product [Aureobasidium uvarum]|uniref:Uncharacterized protein n=1 Tax=Aureobasidium uvarum TaxID=2773716 RepID=A0A9N8KGR6_9PEZI|nr:unnamed protein product [Aureobasidium uvarum]
MSQSTTTPIKQAKAPAAAGSEKDPVRMIEKLDIKTKAVYVYPFASLKCRLGPNGCTCKHDLANCSADRH